MYVPHELVLETRYRWKTAVIESIHWLEIKCVFIGRKGIIGRFFGVNRPKYSTVLCALEIKFRMSATNRLFMFYQNSFKKSRISATHFKPTEKVWSKCQPIITIWPDYWHLAVARRSLWVESAWRNQPRSFYLLTFQLFDIQSRIEHFDRFLKKKNNFYENS